MSIIQGHAKSSGVTGFYPKTIDQSLRFNDNDSAYLSWPDSYAGDQQKWTFSCWVKRGNIGVQSALLIPYYGGDGSNESVFRFETTDKIRIYDSGATRGDLYTTRLFRDVSAWYHIVLVVDLAQGTNTDRVKLYVNGDLETLTGTYPSSTTWGWNGTSTHYLGAYRGTGSYADCYFSDVHFLNGIAATADDFGELKSGVWVAKAYEGAYDSAAQISAGTTNGFYLDFATSGDGTTEDLSGNGNNWTENNLTASDVVLDSPTDNFCTWNPIAKQTGSMAGTPNLSDGNLTITSGSGDMSAHGTFLLSSGQWYWEITYVYGNSAYAGIAYNGSSTNREDGVVYWKDGRKAIDNVFTSYGASYTAGDVIGIALDTNANTVTFYKNNVSQGAISYTPQSTDPTPAIILAASGGTKISANFGQQPFTYTPPTDYLALSTANLPDPVIDPAQDESPRDYFDTFLYTGNGAGLQVGDVIKKPADTTTISNSLICNGADNIDFTRTMADSNRKTWTLSFWLKRSNLNTTQYVASAGNDINRYEYVRFETDNQITMYFRGSSTTDKLTLRPAMAFEDTSRWYHIVWTYDSDGQASSPDNTKIYVDGLLISDWDTRVGTITTDWETTMNGPYKHMWGGLSRAVTTNTFDGYFAEIHFIDGAVHEPTDFGAFDANGIWIPKEVTGITYGTNGYHLDFSDNSTADALVTDQTVNGNDFTATNIDETTDQVSDSPTNNFATLSSSVNSGLTLSEGNLNFYSNGSNRDTAVATIAVSSGKWYWEVTAGTYAGHLIGVVPENYRPASDSRIGLDDDGIGWRTDISYLYYDGAQQESYGSSLSNGNVVGVALDLDNDTIEWFKNGVSLGSKSFTFTGAYAPAVSDPSNVNQCEGSINFGQRGFTYTPPTGYLALSEDNITVDETNLASPDLVWIKNRDQADQHHLYDSVRGIQKALYSNATTAETDEPNGLVDFNANGFTIGSEAEVNTSGEDYVAWCWKANGSAVSNNVGSIPSQVSANTESGFSIVSYTGTGANATVGHGLDSAPDFTLIKNRDGGEAWIAFHSSRSGERGLLTTAAFIATTTYYTSDPTDTVLNLASIGNVNGSGDEMIAYCFHSVEGFSKFGSYTGNGSTDGPFVYTGFRPAFVMVKRTNSTGNWPIIDDARFTYNSDEPSTSGTLIANASAAESGITGYNWDELANGFKLRATSTTINASGSTYIYMAFAENPFKYSNAR